VKFTLLLAQWPAVAYQGRVLTREGANNRLASYWFSRDMTDADFETYCRTGIAPETKGKRVKAAAAAPVMQAPAAEWDEDEEVIPVRRGRR
jgi:hypothetical protein